MIHDILDGFLLIVASFIYSLFGEARPDHIEFAEMPAALTTFAEAVALVVMWKIIISEMVCSFFEVLLLFLMILLILF